MLVLFGAIALMNVARNPRFEAFHTVDVLGLMASAKVADSTSLYLRYDGELQGGTTSNIFFAGLRMTW